MQFLYSIDGSTWTSLWQKTAQVQTNQDSEWFSANLDASGTYPRYFCFSNAQPTKLINSRDVAFDAFLLQYSPSPAPTYLPTPTPGPIHEPSFKPTYVPSPNPTPDPTVVPSLLPTQRPTPLPTPEPTPEPTSLPTSLPTYSLLPSPAPTQLPSLVPSPEPSPLPTTYDTVTMQVLMVAQVSSSNDVTEAVLEVALVDKLAGAAASTSSTIRNTIVESVGSSLGDSSNGPTSNNDSRSSNSLGIVSNADGISSRSTSRFPRLLAGNELVNVTFHIVSPLSSLGYLNADAFEVTYFSRALTILLHLTQHLHLSTFLSAASAQLKCLSNHSMLFFSDITT